MIKLDRDQDVFVLRMNDNENRFSPDMLDAFDAALTVVESTEGPNALVTTGTGKFFSNGLDLNWLGANPGQATEYLGRIHQLFARYLHLPCATVAASNGHTYAAGAMLAICHDHRIMRTDRGYWCLPEVDLGMSFTTGMNALIPALLPTRTAHEAMVTARRYTAADALAAGIVDAVGAEAEVLPQAIAAAQALADKASPAIATIRTTLYADVLTALAQ